MPLHIGSFPSTKIAIGDYPSTEGDATKVVVLFAAVYGFMRNQRVNRLCTKNSAMFKAKGLFCAEMKMLRLSLCPRPMPRGSEAAKPSSCGFRRLAILVICFALPGNAVAAGGPGKVFRRLLAPFRSHPILQTTTGPCSIGAADCGKLFAAAQLKPVKFEPAPVVEDPERVVTMQLRTLRRGPFCPHWLELEGSHGTVTMGYGPATVPLIDAGEIGVRDQYGNYEVITGMHPVPMLALPPVNYHYAKAVGRGRPIGKPIHLTVAQADAVVQKNYSTSSSYPTSRSSTTVGRMSAALRQAPRASHRCLATFSSKATGSRVHFSRPDLIRMAGAKGIRRTA